MEKRYIEQETDEIRKLLNSDKSYLCYHTDKSLTDEDLRKWSKRMDTDKAVNLSKLTQEQLHVLKDKATELPFSGALLKNKDTGDYTCAACGVRLFESGAKFDTGSGWPSFDKAIPGSITETVDNSHGMTRIEVTCSNCGGHLGHLFDDGPKDTTGQRFCINSMSLDFVPKSK